MKQLLDIIEGLKVNSKTKISNTELNINFNYDDCLFNDSDLNKIIKFIEKMPLLPKEVVLADNGKTIVLKYRHFSKKDEFVRIFFISEAGGYKIGFRKTLFDGVAFYPSSTNVNFDTIEKCFTCVNNCWETWKKYIKK